MITNIFDIQFKKGEIFIGKHIYIKNDNLYMTKEFAEYLIGHKESKGWWIHLNHRYIVYNKNGINYKCNLYVRKFNGFINEKKRFNYILTGSSGSTGFNGMQDTKKLTLGIKVVRKANKFIVDEYMNSKFSRLEKIQQIRNKI